MRNFIEKFVNQDCVVYLEGGQQVLGKIAEVSENAIYLERENKNFEVINMRYILRVRQHPLDKKGRKVSVIFD